jgi:O-antigen/teichoic acid export membrane protein
LGRSEQGPPREGERATNLAAATPDGPTDFSTAATRRQIRGSALLLAGRVLSLGINFAVQVLIVRYLSKEAYGAFAYALSIAVFGQTIVTFGLDRAVTRFVPMYDERHDYARVFGALFLVGTTVIGLGLAFIALVYGLQGLIGQTLIHDQTALSLLLILVVLTPVQALDDLLTGLFAVLAAPRAIFFRKYLLTPSFRLVVVIALILGDAGVFFLSGGYVVAAAVGVAIYASMLVRTLRTRGLLDHFDRHRMRIPAREILSFTIPLLTTDLVYAVMAVSDAILLGHFRGSTAVAALRAVQPAAQLNMLAFSTFLLLFTPHVARLFARGDRAGVGRLYWQTTVWIAVVSFPIFVLTFALAKPLTLLLFGPRYESSAVLLGILALGYYFQAALGFNGTTLMVYGRLKYIVVVNVLAVLVNIGLNVVLIPAYGTVGAAIGTAGTLVAHNVLKQGALQTATGISFFRRSYISTYASIVVAATGVLIVSHAIDSRLAQLSLAVVATVAIFGVNHRVLEIGQTFPELMRFPGLRRLVRGA